MSARDEIMGLASRISAGLSPEWCDEMREHMDAYAHELAEKIYRRAEEADVAGQRSFACGAHAAGTWIDPEVSTDG